MLTGALLVVLARDAGAPLVRPLTPRAGDGLLTAGDRDVRFTFCPFRA